MFKSLTTQDIRVIIILMVTTLMAMFHGMLWSKGQREKAQKEAEQRLEQFKED